MIKKLSLLAGASAGFVAGSWAGRRPYETFVGAVRNAMKQPKVHTTLDSASKNAVAVRDATLDAAAEAMEKVSMAATGMMDETSRRVTHGHQGSH
jgi:hypothetical protein